LITHKLQISETDSRFTMRNFPLFLYPLMGIDWQKQLSYFSAKK